MIDQTTKSWAIRNLRFDGDREIISGFLNFAYAQNTGVAFSMFDDHGDSGRWVLSERGVYRCGVGFVFFLENSAF